MQPDLSLLPPLPQWSRTDQQVPPQSAVPLQQAQPQRRSPLLMSPSLQAQPLPAYPRKKFLSAALLQQTQPQRRSPLRMPPSLQEQFLLQVPAAPPVRALRPVPPRLPSPLPFLRKSFPPQRQSRLKQAFYTVPAQTQYPAPCSR